MPLLTIAMADVPAADSGLGSGITNVSQQISGALGLAVLSTIAANRTKGLLSAHQGLTTSLIGGYHLAFVIGAATITAGIVLAFAVLRPRRAGRRGTGRAPRRTTPLASTSTSKEKPHDPHNSLPRPQDPVKPSRPPLAARRGSRRPNARLISEGVVASYIHDISQRHRDGVRGHSARRDIAARADVLIAEGRQRDHMYRAR